VNTIVGEDRSLYPFSGIVRGHAPLFNDAVFLVRVCRLSGAQQQSVPGALV